MEERVLRAALAGLLHDIGKFSQRGGETPRQRFEKKEVGAHGAHAAWSADFVSHYLPDDWKRLSGVLFHHAPKSEDDYLIQLADWLSSGEREGDTENREQRLLSIFSRLWEGAGNDQWYYSLRRLAIEDDVLFPSTSQVPQTETRKQYTGLWREFTQACETARLREINNGEALLETLYHLLCQHR